MAKEVLPLTGSPSDTDGEPESFETVVLGPKTLLGTSTISSLPLASITTEKLPTPKPATEADSLEKTVIISVNGTGEYPQKREYSLDTSTGEDPEATLIISLRN